MAAGRFCGVSTGARLSWSGRRPHYFHIAIAAVKSRAEQRCGRTMRVAALVCLSMWCPRAALRRLWTPLSSALASEKVSELIRICFMMIFRRRFYRRSGHVRHVSDRLQTLDDSTRACWHARQAAQDCSCASALQPTDLKRSHRHEALFEQSPFRSRLRTCGVLTTIRLVSAAPMSSPLTCSRGVSRPRVQQQSLTG